MDSISEKYLMSVPGQTAFRKLGIAQKTDASAESSENKGIIDSVKETAEKLNPLNLVDKAGNFALRAVVILVSTGLIMIGFYFMFKDQVKDMVKAVV